METLIKKGPSGHLLIPSLEQVALRLSKVEDRLHQIEEQLKTD